jgi:hypothetical protein
MVSASADCTSAMAARWMLFSARDRLKSDHVVGGALALLVQAIFALLVLLSPSHSTRPASPARETLLFFPPLAVPAPSTIDARGLRRKRIAPSDTLLVPPVASPPAVASPLAPPSGLAGDLASFGRALFGCAPENITNLDEAQQSRCWKFGALPPYDPNVMDYADHSDKVPGAKRWERELARKKAPLLLPCGNSRALDPVYTAACIIANIANGFTFKQQYENQPVYSDKSGK